MSREHVQKVIEEFIDTSTPEVLAITGPWGVGKTYAIRALVARYKGKHSLKRYTYVSLCGAQSLASVRTDVLPAFADCRLKTKPTNPAEKGPHASCRFES
jgi:Cdc6-like AAA superfamily ATPase